MNHSKHNFEASIELTDDLSPSDVIRLRCEALKMGRYDLVYDTAHSESNFRKHFPRKLDYLVYAEASLKGEIHFADYALCEQRKREDEALVLFVTEFLANAERHKLVEVAHLRLTPKGWRYLYGEKVRFEDLPPVPDPLTFEAFEAVTEKTVY